MRPTARRWKTRAHAAASLPAKNAPDLSDPPATQTPNATGYVLHKELDAYKSYGAQDMACDVLYDKNEIGAWTFTIPAGTITSATVVLSMVTDDSVSLPQSSYSLSVWSGACQFDSVGQLPHGAPFASTFTNWTPLTFAADLTPGSTYTVTVSNTTQTGSGGWMAIDWIELRVVTN